MQTLATFLEGSELALRCRQVNYDYEYLFMQPDISKHYACRLYGSDGAHAVTTIIASDNGPPELPEVLDSIAADVAVVDEVGGFARWARTMGFDPRSPSDEQIYRSLCNKARLLREILGDKRYDQLLWQTERL